MQTFEAYVAWCRRTRSGFLIANGARAHAVHVAVQLLDDVGVGEAVCLVTGQRGWALWGEAEVEAALRRAIRRSGEAEVFLVDGVGAVPVRRWAEALEEAGARVGVRRDDAVDAWLGPVPDLLVVGTRGVRLEWWDRAWQAVASFHNPMLVEVVGPILERVRSRCRSWRG